MKPQGKFRKIVTTNAKSIKLWKLVEKPEKRVVKSSGKELSMPKLETI